MMHLLMAEGLVQLVQRGFKLAFDKESVATVLMPAGSAAEAAAAAGLIRGDFADDGASVKLDLGGGRGVAVHANGSYVVSYP